MSYAKKNGIESDSLEFRHFDKAKIIKYYLSIEVNFFQEEFKELCEPLKKAKYNSNDWMEAVVTFADFAFLSCVMKQELKDKNIYVMVGADHADFMSKAFFQYKYIKTVDVGKNTDYKDLFDKNWNPLINKYALDLESALKQCGKK